MDLKEKEKKRELTEAEKRRLNNYNDICDDLVQHGYKKTELTISIVKANIFGIVFAIPVFVIGLFLFHLKNGFSSDMLFTFRETLIFVFGLIILVFLHEFVHGFVWGLYSEHYFKDIEFGFMRQYLTPYCTCTEPLRKGPYIAGGIMPLIALGILPTVAAIFNGSYMMLIMGLIMTVSAAGDIMIIYKLVKFRTSSETVLCLDHPTMGGVAVFEK